METDQNLKYIEPEGERSDFCAFYVLGCFGTLLEGIVHFLLDRRIDITFIEV